MFATNPRISCKSFSILFFFSTFTRLRWLNELLFRWLRVFLLCACTAYYIIFISPRDSISPVVGYIIEISAISYGLYSDRIPIPRGNYERIRCNCIACCPPYQSDARRARIRSCYCSSLSNRKNATLHFVHYNNSLFD